MKGGQVYSQALIYIFTLVLVSVILIYGYNAISNFRSRAAEVSMLKLRSDISNSIAEMASEYQSEKTKAFNLPSEIRKVCFIETYDGAPAAGSLNFNVIIKDSVMTESTGVTDPEKIKKIRNVFLLGDSVNSVKDSFNVPVKIEVRDSATPNPNNEVLCKDSIGGRISLKIEGKGDGVALS